MGCEGVVMGRVCGGCVESYMVCYVLRLPMVAAAFPTFQVTSNCQIWNGACVLERRKDEGERRGKE